jgi:indole-3-glycerol phosphate synthase
MATGSLQVNRDIILATKKQHLKQRQRHTPMEAVLALAQMQQRPRGLLNYSSDGDKIKVIAQVSRREIYDPVTSALHCIVNGADAIGFFTDHSIYHNDLDDLLMVARAVKDTPVIYQNYVLNEYEVMAARGADASAVVVYASLMDSMRLRQTVSTAQRWKMSTIVQISDMNDLESAKTLSPHALSFGDNLSSNIAATVQDLIAARESLPAHYRLLLTHSLHNLDEVELALSARVDAIIVDEDLLKHERSARMIQSLVEDAQKARENQKS